jgi:tellurite resistance protein TehA-like permease
LMKFCKTTIFISIMTVLSHYVNRKHNSFITNVLHCIELIITILYKFSCLQLHQSLPRKKHCKNTYFSLKIHFPFNSWDINNPRQ